MSLIAPAQCARRWLIMLLVGAAFLGGCHQGTTPIPPESSPAAPPQSMATLPPSATPTHKATDMPTPTAVGAHELRPGIGPAIDVSLAVNQAYCPFIPRYPDAIEQQYISNERPGYISKTATYTTTADEASITRWFMQALGRSGWEFGLGSDPSIAMTHYYQFSERVQYPPVTRLDIRLIPRSDAPGTTMDVIFTMADSHSMATWCAATRP
jgi:hypothetical protein